MSEFRETTYTCPVCGFSFRVPEFGEDLPPAPPRLVCPVCSGRTYRTSDAERYDAERYVFQSFCRSRSEVRAVIARLCAEEAEGRCG